MNSPCGHREATCVIGNYWNCPLCDNKGNSSAPEEKQGEIVTIYRTWAASNNTALYGFDYLTKPWGIHTTTWLAPKSAVIDRGQANVANGKSISTVVLRAGTKLTRVTKEK